jgi:sugar phosphate isomerase/epimerase
MRERQVNRFAISALDDELEKSGLFCKSEGVGIEVTDFAFPANLGEGLSANIDRHLKIVEGIAPLSLHGPFIDMIAASLDPEIVAITRERHNAALEAAVEIGASIYVVHTNYNPLIRDAAYRKNWTKRTVDFWLPFADKAGKHGIVISMENLWEGTPDIQVELLEKANHPNLRATFDNGHALIFSELTAAEWIKGLGTNLAHCHLHDNSGEIDEHKPVGEGIEKWPELMSAIEDHAREAVLVVESDLLSENQASLDYLRQLDH